MSFITDTFFGGAAKKASKAQVKATQMGIDELRRQFDLTRSDLAPWREAGATALGAGAAMLQPGYDYKTSPGYDFRFNEGQRAVESSGAAKGTLMSGGTLRDLLRVGDGIASQDFNDQFNRQMAIAGGGQQATTAGASLGQNTANGIADLFTQQGNARASGYIGQAQGIQQGIGQLAQIAGMFASDRRLKKNIEKVGEFEDGLGIYTWVYRNDPDATTYRGVMADEVKELRPAAYIENFDGLGHAGVNYGALNAN